eukprot:NODE_3835_length_846_cov_105.752434_g3812_i0.p1 GENE.NODE_3835_length_846_cov_105.752434_g3812_i0~~NODE_3835_length_846_cov_105.752434_g3812_i0.p1  ORF type:complete len:181 (+),score=20.98 NODE_3835_length_846_cov_105.752434_g3812_i0:77-619(+)
MQPSTAGFVEAVCEMELRKLYSQSPASVPSSQSDNGISSISSAGSECGSLDEEGSVPVSVPLLTNMLAELLGGNQSHLTAALLQPLSGDVQDPSARLGSMNESLEPVPEVTPRATMLASQFQLGEATPAASAMPAGAVQVTPPCGHDNWKRLRCKKGVGHFLCETCQCKWHQAGRRGFFV